MPILLGEPVGVQPSSAPLMTVGPLTFQGSLSANSQTQFCYPRASTYQTSNYNWAYLGTPLMLRGMSGVINSNGIASGATITFNVYAQASSIGGTETGTLISGTNYVTAGATTGFFSLTYPQAIALPTVAAGGTIFVGGIISTAAGSIDVLAWLHLEV